jgi:hypothetical protein
MNAIEIRKENLFIDLINKLVKIEGKIAETLFTNVFLETRKPF